MEGLAGFHNEAGLDGFNYSKPNFIPPSNNHSFWQIYRPAHPCGATGSQSHHFQIWNPDEPVFTDLSSLTVNGCIQLFNSDNTQLTSEETISTVNLFHEALFEQISVGINCVNISYHNRAYYLISYNTKTFLITRIWKHQFFKLNSFYQMMKKMLLQP